MHKTSINIPTKTREAIIKILNARLADAVDLGIQSKLAHWNVRGATFIALHELFDKVAALGFEHADTIAERIGALGGVAHGNIQETAKATSLPKFDIKLKKEKETTTAVVKAIATFTNAVRKDIDNTADLGDMVTSDILTGISGEADKMLWFVEAHLQ